MGWRHALTLEVYPNPSRSKPKSLSVALYFHVLPHCHTESVSKGAYQESLESCRECHFGVPGVSSKNIKLSYQECLRTRFFLGNRLSGKRAFGLVGCILFKETCRTTIQRWISQLWAYGTGGCRQLRPKDPWSKFSVQFHGSPRRRPIQRLAQSELQSCSYTDVLRVVLRGS